MKGAARALFSSERRLIVGMAAAVGAVGQGSVLSAATGTVAAAGPPEVLWGTWRRINAGDHNVSYADIGPRYGASLPQEAPQAFANAILEAISLSQQDPGA